MHDGPEGVGWGEVLRTGEWRKDVIGIYLMTEDRMKLRAVVKTATKFLVL